MTIFSSILKPQGAHQWATIGPVLLSTLFGKGFLNQKKKSPDSHVPWLTVPSKALGCPHKTDRDLEPGPEFFPRPLDEVLPSW
jgi:hypothetical protein